jgi:hypothetical protein
MLPLSRRIYLEASITETPTIRKSLKSSLKFRNSGQSLDTNENPILSRRAPALGTAMGTKSAEIRSGDT